MGIKFTEAEIERKTELRAQIAANPTSPEVSSWQAELQEIVTTARSRMFQRAKQRQTKAEEKEEEARVEVVKIEDMLSPEELAQSKEDWARIHELQTAIAATTRKKEKAELEDELTELDDFEAELWRKAERRAVKAGKCLATPTREDYHDDEFFEEAMEWHRLNLAEAACYRKLNSAKTSFNLRRDVEKELDRIEKKRRALRPDEFEPESRSESKSDPADTPTLDSDDRDEQITEAKAASSVDCSDLSDVALRESYFKQKFFRDQLGFTDNGPLIAALEKEIRRRKMQLVWAIEGTNRHVDEAGAEIANRSKTVYTGQFRIPIPSRKQNHP